MRANTDSPCTRPTVNDHDGCQTAETICCSVKGSEILLWLLCMNLNSSNLIEREFCRKTHESFAGMCYLQGPCARRCRTVHQVVHVQYLICNISVCLTACNISACLTSIMLWWRHIGSSISTLRQSSGVWILDSVLYYSFIEFNLVRDKCVSVVACRILRKAR